MRFAKVRSRPKQVFQLLDGVVCYLCKTRSRYMRGALAHGHFTAFESSLVLQARVRYQSGDVQAADYFEDEDMLVRVSNIVGPRLLSAPDSVASASAQEQINRFQVRPTLHAATFERRKSMYTSVRSFLPVLSYLSEPQLCLFQYICIIQSDMSNWSAPIRLSAYGGGFGCRLKRLVGAPTLILSQRFLPMSVAHMS